MTQPFPSVTFCPMNTVRCEGLFLLAKDCWLDPTKCAEANDKDKYCEIAYTSGCNSLFNFNPNAKAVIDAACDFSGRPDFRDPEGMLSVVKSIKEHCCTNNNG